MKIHTLVRIVLMGATTGVALPAVHAQPIAGFYGGIVLQEGARSTGVSLDGSGSRGLRAPGTDEASTRQVFGGYRWKNDLAVEAAFARSESYALRPFSASTPTGVGLALGGRDLAPQAAYNLDVFGSYTFLRSFALYGRVGYAQNEPAGSGVTTLVAYPDARLVRDGVNYGLGLRYDMTRTLGVNLEYARFGRFAFDSFGSTLPDNDQVRLGVQFRF